MWSQSPRSPSLSTVILFLQVQTWKCTAERFQKEIGPAFCAILSNLSIVLVAAFESLHQPLIWKPRAVQPFCPTLHALWGKGWLLCDILRRPHEPAGKKSSPRATRRRGFSRPSRLDSCLVKKKRRGGGKERNGHMMRSARGEDASVQRLRSFQ